MEGVKSLIKNEENIITFTTNHLVNPKMKDMEH
jgi:hypothetical protein